MPSVLFVCTANQYRSPLAALSFSRLLVNNRPAGKWVVESAGTWAKAGMSSPPFMVKIANDLGLQGLEKHRSKQIDLKMIDQFDLIIVMELGHKEALCNEFLQAKKRIFLLSEIAEDAVYSISDPLTPDIDPTKIARQIDQLVNKGFNRIVAAAGYFEQKRLAIK